MSALYLVPTPIGNLGDITYRAVEVLKKVDLVLAEDTRKTGILLRHLQISKPVRPHHKFNEHRTLETMIQKLLAGTSIALVTDAGTPGISDPGFLLVRGCIDHGIDIETLPGPTAFIPALVNSGLPSDRFVFEGFLPRKKGRQKRLAELSPEQRTMIFYESPFRLCSTLQQLAGTFGNERQASVSRELTKVHEETIRGTLKELRDYFGEHSPRGEIVIVVGGRLKE
jgi:16S rRNA (cytidine1402-2'-O)-methyltransferase